jgi:hypothetical protein
MDPEDTSVPAFFTAKQALPLTAFLSANPKEDEGDLKAQALAEKALPVMIARDMSEAQGKRLVAAVKGGQQPEDYTAQKVLNHEGTKGTKKGEADGLNQQPILAQTSQTQKPEIATSQTKPIGSAPRNDSHQTNQGGGSNPPPHSGFWSFLVGWVKQEAMKSLRQSIQHFLKRLVSTVVKTAVVFTLLAVGVFFFIPGSASRKIAWFMNVQPPRIQTGLNHQDTKESKADGMETTTNPKSEIAIPSVPSGQAPQTEPIGSAPRAGGQPSPEGDYKERKQVGQPSAEAASTQANPETNKQRNARLALEFASHYYGYDYKNMDPWFDFFKNSITDGMYDHFMSKHYPPDEIKHIAERKWTMAFQPTQPVKYLGSDDVAHYFLVEGTMTWRTDIHKPNELITKKPGAVQIGFTHETGQEDKVFFLEELTPAKAQSLSAGAQEMSDSDGATSPPQAKPSAPSHGDLVTQVGDAAKKALGL